MKIFISQPMRNKSHANIKQEREEVVSRLKEEYGEIEVIDLVFPMITGKRNNSLRYLAKSLELMCDADIVVFAQGYEYARGCKIEYECAVNYGLAVKIL